MDASPYQSGGDIEGTLPHVAEGVVGRGLFAGGSFSPSGLPSIAWQIGGQS